MDLDRLGVGPDDELVAADRAATMGIATRNQDDPRVSIRAECRSSDIPPSVYIRLENPGPDLRQLRFDTQIPVMFRWQPPPRSNPAPASEAHAIGMLSSGVSPNTNYIVVGLGLKGGATAATFLGRNLGPEESTVRAVVTIKDTSVTLSMLGAHKAFDTLKRNCQPRR